MKTHGLTNSRIYHIWHAIKQRCTYEHAQMYRYYGGRGIKYVKTGLIILNIFILGL